MCLNSYYGAYTDPPNAVIAEHHRAARGLYRTHYFVVLCNVGHRRRCRPVFDVRARFGGDNFRICRRCLSSGYDLCCRHIPADLRGREISQGRRCRCASPRHFLASADGSGAWRNAWVWRCGNRRYPVRDRKAVFRKRCSNIDRYHGRCSIPVAGAGALNRACDDCAGFCRRHPHWMDRKLHSWWQFSPGERRKCRMPGAWLSVSRRLEDKTSRSPLDGSYDPRDRTWTACRLPDRCRRHSWQRNNRGTGNTGWRDRRNACCDHAPHATKPARAACAVANGGKPRSPHR